MELKLEFVHFLVAVSLGLSFSPRDRHAPAPLQHITSIPLDVFGGGGGGGGCQLLMSPLGLFNLGISAG